MTYGDVMVNRLNPGRFIDFLDLCLLVILWKNGGRVFIAFA